MRVFDRGRMKKIWTIRRYASHDDFLAGKPSAVPDGKTGKLLPAMSKIHGNVLLNEGIAELLDLACGLGTPTNFGNSNAYLGVGDDTTAESASHTGLQAATNKLYVAVDASYPQRASQTVTWRGTFDIDQANFNWREFTVANGSSNTAKNLNRKVSTQGTKASGQVWTLDLSITVS